MTPRRQRMLEDMQLRGLSARTQECDVAAVRQLAEHDHRSPTQITEEDLRQYCLSLANEKKVARATATIALCGIRCFFEHTLHRDWTTLRFVRPAREQRWPVVVSRDEVRRILAAVRIPVYRACLTTIYACGLRLLEGAQLQVEQIDGARRLLLVHGNGKHDRYVPLAPPLLAMLRTYWRTHRSPIWLFPAPTRHGLAHRLAHDGGPVTDRSLQRACRRAVQKSGVATRAHVHTLRHAYATHVLEASSPSPDHPGGARPPACPHDPDRHASDAGGPGHAPGSADAPRRRPLLIGRGRRAGGGGPHPSLRGRRARAAGIGSAPEPGACAAGSRYE